MKRTYFFLTFLLVTAFLVGCASTPKSEIDTFYYKNQQTGKKTAITEWKYMGFGQDFPQWVIPALENNVEKIKNSEVDLQTSDVVILHAEGFNLDQAVDSLKLQKKPEDYNLYDSFWVRTDLDKKYIALAVYYK